MSVRFWSAAGCSERTEKPASTMSSWEGASKSFRTTMQCAVPLQQHYNQPSFSRSLSLTRRLDFSFIENIILNHCK